MTTRLQLNELDRRDLPAVTVGDPSEAYAWALINEMRQDPAGFARQLDGLRTGAISSAFGYAKTDPVVADLNRLLQYSAYPGHYSQALATLRGTAALGPLGWDDVLADRADGHTDWMKTHAFEHTGHDSPNKTYIPGFSSTYRGGDPDTWGYDPGRYYWWGEDIGYTYGLMASSKAAYVAGKVGAIGFQQRAAFIDTVSYILEVNSPDFAHLQQLLRSDAAPDGGVPHFNAIGIDLDFFEGPSEARDGFGEATISTHRLGLYRPGSTGGFLTGLLFADLNGNGTFDSGEGIGGTLTVTGPVSFTETLSRANSFGVYSRFVPNGSYQVTATSDTGAALGSLFVTVNNNNAWFEYGAAVTSAPVGPRTVTITGPTGDVGVRPGFTWTAVEGAAGYDVRLVDRSGAVYGVWNNQVSGTDWTPPADLIPGRSYRLSVRPALNRGDGIWTNYDFQVAAPRLTVPATSTSVRPTLTWTAVPGAAGYVVWIDDLTGGKSNLVPGARVADPNWSPPADLVSGRAYRLWVRAVNDRGFGGWSAAATFTVSTPTPSAASTLPTGRPTFLWSAVNGATDYVVWVDDLTTGKQMAFRQTTTAPSWVPPTDLAAGHTYRWWVMARNKAGVGCWSAPSMLRITL